MNKSNVVVESYSVRFWESVKIRQVRRRSIKSTKQILAETDGFELLTEVSFCTESSEETPTLKYVLNIKFVIL